MKKKVLILMPSMFIGGAERSLIGLLEAFDYEKYEVDLFLYRHEGEFLKYIPKEVNLLSEVAKYTTFDRPIKDILKSKLFGFGLARLISKLDLFFYCILHREEKDVWKSMQYISKYITPLLPNIQEHYNLAINFLGIHDVLNKKVNADTKLGWIHTDYLKLFPNKKMDRNSINPLDRIVFVSEDCKESFIKVYPEFKNKAMVMENILSKNFIEKQSQELIVDISNKNNNEKYICSVGRFSKQKNFENIPFICKNLIKENHDIRWFIIGYGSDEELINNNIIEAGMSKYIKVLGKKENPYPYIKLCDIYIQPSRYEGKAVTVREAQILEKPVIITNFATSSSQLYDGIDGVIVPLDNKACADGISKVIDNKELINKLINNMKHIDYENKNEIKKIYDFME